MTEEFERYNSYFKKENLHLELRQTETMGRGLFTTRDIKSGELILTSEIYNFAVNYPIKSEVCENCLTQIESHALSCEICNEEVFYCSEECKSDHRELHNFECEYFSKIQNFLAEELKIEDSLFRKKLLFHDLMTQLKFFLKLIAKSEAEEALKKSFPIGGIEQDTSLKLTFKDDYLRFFSPRKMITDVETRNQLIKIQEAIRQITNQKMTFEETMDMIAKDQCNSFELDIGYCNVPVLNFVNHSCSPNSEYWFVNGKFHLFPLHDIPKETELKVSYIPISPPSDRRKKRLKDFFVECNCSPKSRYCNSEFMKEYLCPDCKKELTFQIDPNNEQRICKECIKQNLQN
eukprot:gene8659-606_t